MVIDTLAAVEVVFLVFLVSVGMLVLDIVIFDVAVVNVGTVVVVGVCADVLVLCVAALDILMVFKFAVVDVAIYELPF